MAASKSNLTQDTRSDERRTAVLFGLRCRGVRGRGPDPGGSMTDAQITDEVMCYLARVALVCAVAALILAAL